MNGEILQLGAYTLPDAARLLGIPLYRLRSWVVGRDDQNGFLYQGSGLDRTFGFYTLIELFTVAQLRARGVTWKTLRAARQELSVRFQTSHPFAMKGLLVHRGRLLKELGDDALLELGSGGQTAFEKVLAPFCQRLDFDTRTGLARRFYPAGQESPVVVDPRQAFGRPVIEGTNVTTEALACLIRGGETIDDLAADFQLDRQKVEEAWQFEQRMAA